MSEDVFEDTIDWEQYWADADEEDRERATPSATHARDLLAAFFTERGIPDSFADVGCDPGPVAFDVVFCHGTLTYVRESDHAVQQLYDAVAPGGTLIAGYTNDLAGAHYRNVVENPPQDENGDPAVDPERFAARFQLAIEGESTLSYDTIHDALDTWPRSFWSVVDKPEERWAWRNHPLVWVPK